MEKTIILSKDQYCYRENLNPKDFKTVEEVSKFLNFRDRQEKEQKLRELVEFQNK
jgi:hypothetical protein